MKELEPSYSSLVQVRLSRSVLGTRLGLNFQDGRRSKHTASRCFENRIDLLIIATYTCILLAVEEGGPCFGLISYICVSFIEFGHVVP